MLRVRMGVHTGEPAVTGEGYVGVDVHRAARIAAAAHGGQVAALGKRRATSLGATASRFATSGSTGSRTWTRHSGLPARGAGLENDFPPLRTLETGREPADAADAADRPRGRGARVCELIDARRAAGHADRAGGYRQDPARAPGRRRAGRRVRRRRLLRLLAALPDPELVLPTIAQALGVREAGGEPLQRGRRLLLVLDNFEQVARRGAGRLRPAGLCPQLAILVTSREPLHVRAEHEWPVPPLAEEAAVELFAERRLRPSGRSSAQERRPTRSAAGLTGSHSRSSWRRHTCARCHQGRCWSGSNAGSICSAPVLAIFRSGTERFARRSTGPTELLTPIEQGLFARLAVFAGGCTPVAAETVCDTDVLTLESLVEKSLLRESDGRFWMLETIREFARERLKVWTRTTECGNVTRTSSRRSRRAGRGGLAGPGQAGGDRPTPSDNISSRLAWLEEIGDPMPCSRSSSEWRASGRRVGAGARGAARWTLR